MPRGVTGRIAHFELPAPQLQLHAMHQIDARLRTRIKGRDPEQTRTPIEPPQGLVARMEGDDRRTGGQSDQVGHAGEMVEVSVG